VPGRLPGLHPIQLYWFWARMTGVPLAAISGGAGAGSLLALCSPKFDELDFQV